MQKNVLTKLIRSSLKSTYIISLYLEVDGKKYPNDEYLIVLKELLKEVKQSIQTYSDEQKKNLLDNFDAIWNHFQLNYERAQEKTIALFCSANKRLWELIPLSIQLRSSLVIREYPYLRPLIQALHLQKKFGTLLIDRTKAVFCLSSNDDTKAVTSLSTEVPQKVKAAGYKGYAEKKMERHIEDHVQRHFKNVAEKLIQFCNKNECDHLILGGEKRNIEDFTSYLSEIWKSKVIAGIFLNVESDIKEISQKAHAALQKFYSEKEIVLLEKIKQEALAKGLGTYGLEGVFEAIRHKQVSSLAVKQNFSLPGKKCKNCNWLHINITTCQVCGSKMVDAPDIIEEAINESLLQNSDVYVVAYHPSMIAEMEGIGALLRFQI
ncbi:MAG: hypothetical protein A2Y62_05705 [Candidatus Fischerbacteria bacterium RBG_13_37_8]|uniref:eRF1 domain-containing protein n=1 Tax=Candidatus Fischerbacteria bacterium RBG_13_37_8 TaxID=1817863 RepID=A0A1F5VYH9_9BACT|nr:MAG: hypothetical protein A2Y62_05705 [Candidatus Fischerbacteria bacterium RBG_13_37_8]